jgi:hypothetical protein
MTVVSAPFSLTVTHEDDFHPAHAYILTPVGISPVSDRDGFRSDREVPGAAAGLAATGVPKIQSGHRALHPR